VGPVDDITPLSGTHLPVLRYFLTSFKKGRKFMGQPLFSI